MILAVTSIPFFDFYLSIFNTELQIEHSSFLRFLFCFKLATMMSS